MSERSMAANIRRLTLTIAIAFLATSVGVGYWSLVAAAQLNADPFNPLLIAAIRHRRRRKIFDASGRALTQTVNDGDAHSRRHPGPLLALVIRFVSALVFAI